MERTERRSCTDPRGECRAVRGSCLPQPLPSPSSDSLFHHLLGPMWAPGPFGKPRVGEMRSPLWLEHVILDRRKREQVGALWLGALPACPLSQSSFLRWDKLWTRLTLIPAGPGSKVDSSYARGGGKKFQVPTPAIAPSCFPPTFGLEDALYLGQSGFIEAPGQHRELLICFPCGAVCGILEAGVIYFIGFLGARLEKPGPGLGAADQKQTAACEV